MSAVDRGKDKEEGRLVEKAHWGELQDVTLEGHSAEEIDEERQQITTWVVIIFILLQSKKYASLSHRAINYQVRINHLSFDALHRLFIDVNIVCLIWAALIYSIMI